MVGNKEWIVTGLALLHSGWSSVTFVRDDRRLAEWSNKRPNTDVQSYFDTSGYPMPFPLQKERIFFFSFFNGSKQVDFLG